VVTFAGAGRLVEVDRRRVHVLEAGAGATTVVLEAGAGATLDSWARVIPDLAARTRVVAYDRPGLGFSDARPAPDDRRPVAMAALLATVLDAIDAPPPYVLVGHSLGGLHVRAFAAAHPHDVAGLVLVDPSHEDMRAVLGSASPAQRVLQVVVNGMVSVGARLANFGTGRLLLPLLVPKAAVEQLGLEPARLQAVKRRYLRPDVLRTIAHEHSSVDACLAQVRSLPLPAHIPLTVLSGDRVDRKGRNQHLRDGVNRLHADLAGRSAAGRHVVVPHCGHLVPIEQPQAVVDAVLDLVGPDAQS
jgi:pimeloyl-ACP methyl ester carboxylesterase